jgi:hypothetical protein
MRRLTALVVLLIGLLAPVGASASDPDWTALQRPLHLPALGPGGRCPASKLAPQITGTMYGVEPALGSGPVYPIVPPSGVVAYFRPNGWKTWAGEKVLWFVMPDYTGPVLIRGRRLSGSQLMRFDDGANPRPQIRLASGETVTWTGQVPGSRGRPSYVRVRVPGCYGVQIDGTTFSSIVVFSVTTSH